MKKSEFVRILSTRHLLLPPLSGFTDYPYRKILSRFLPPFITTEMVNAKAVLMENKKTMEMLQILRGEHKNGVQLLGNIPRDMAKAASILESMGFDYIDINMGCTVKKVVSKGQGVSLMRHEALACSIVESVSNAVEIPVTVKMRTGYSESTKNVVSLSKKLEESGATALTIHGRTGEKKFGGRLDYGSISEVVSAVSIPVIANGGITGKNARDVLTETGAAAVMPGRSIIGNPWVIQEILSYFDLASFAEPDLSEKKTIVFDHATFLSDFYGELSGVVRFRKILPKYFNMCSNLRSLKTDVKEIKTLSDVEVLINKIKEDDGMVWYG